MLSLPFQLDPKSCSFHSKCCLLLAVPVTGLGLAWPGHENPGTSVTSWHIQGKFKPIFMCFSSNSVCLPGFSSPSCPATPHKHPRAQQGAAGTCWLPSAHAETPQSHSSPLSGQNSCAAPKVLVIKQDKREQNSERGTQQRLALA